MKTIMRRHCGTLKNAWYAAALSHELTLKKPKQCIIMDEMIVLWRRADGTPSALLDRCPHRNALLSEGPHLHRRLNPMPLPRLDFFC